MKIQKEQRSKSKVLIRKGTIDNAMAKRKMAKNLLDKNKGKLLFENLKKQVSIIFCCPFLCLHVTNMYLFNLCLTYNICVVMCSIVFCILTVWKSKEYHELLRSYVNKNIDLIKNNYEKPSNHSQTIHRKLHITQHKLRCSGKERVIRSWCTTGTFRVIFRHDRIFTKFTF